MKPIRVPQNRPAFLASVKNAFEARAAVAGGADILDCKDPGNGALGAVSPAVIREIMAARSGLTVSATLGDLPNDADLVVAAAKETAATGVHIIKCGIFASAGAVDVIRALGNADLAQARLAAVMMADREPDFDLIPHLAVCGFDVVMLDTAGKSSGSLRDLLSIARLELFLRRASEAGLTAGLAGSLSLEDVAPLVALGPAILGFRGALCSKGRTGTLESVKVEAICAAIDEAAPMAQKAQYATRFRSGQ